MTFHKREREIYSSQADVDDDNGKTKKSGKIVAFMTLNFRKGRFVEINALSIEEFHKYVWPKVCFRKASSCDFDLTLLIGPD
jgi:hypothetical protein